LGKLNGVCFVPPLPWWICIQLRRIIPEDKTKSHEKFLQRDERNGNSNAWFHLMTRSGDFQLWMPMDNGFWRHAKGDGLV